MRPRSRFLLLLTLIVAGLFYGGYGAIMIPSLGVVDVFGGYTPEFYNAMGFFILSTKDLVLSTFLRRQIN